MTKGQKPASVGEQLKTERQRRGVSLQDVAEETKIGKLFLIALENDDIDSLPGGVYRRSFLRSYARFLKLDEDRILADFHAQFSITPHDVIRLESQRRDDRDFIRQRRRLLLRGFWAAILISVLICLYFLIPRPARHSTPTQRNPIQVRKPDPQPPNPPLAQPESDHRIRENLDPDLTSGVEDPPLGPHDPNLPISDVQTIHPANARAVSSIDQVFAIQALADVWVEVTIDQLQVTRRLLPAGQVRVYAYGTEHRVKIGNTALVAIQDGSSFMGPLTRSYHFLNEICFGPGEFQQALMSRLNPED